MCVCVCVCACVRACVVVVVVHIFYVCFAFIFQVVTAICLIIPSDLSLLIDIFIFSSWLFYGWSTVSLLILRYTEPHLHRPYRVSTNPRAGLCGYCYIQICTYMYGTPAHDDIYKITNYLARAFCP